MKRRKLDNNPYTINYYETKNKYMISFNLNNQKQEIEVSKDLYEAFNQFELEDKSYMNKYDRHIEHSELSENSLNIRMIKNFASIDDIVIKNIQYDQLHNAINKLPKIQKDRLIKYYFYNISKKDMSLSENCSIRAIQYSIDVGLKNLKKFLN